MWIWDLATTAFPKMNPWKLWISKCLNSEKMTFTENRLPKREFYAGVRGVISKTSGIILDIDEDSILRDLSKTFGHGSFKLSILKNKSEEVKAIPKDNSDFLAFVSLRNKNYDTLIRDLAQAEQIILNYMTVCS